jgi:two-component system nitrogen regulation response regulator NtrX
MNERILVVDDEPDIRILLKDILEDEGYKVDVAEHARAANELKLSTHPDLVLLDIWMPEVDGVTLLKEWKSSGKDDCPVVMMSGHGTVETAVEATRFGAVDFVEKPLSMAKLLTTVKSALNSRSRNTAPQFVEEPVGHSQTVQLLKQGINSLRDNNVPVFFHGASGSGRRIWAEYLSRTTGGLTLFDNNQALRQFEMNQANLYIEEVADLSVDLQNRLCQKIAAERKPRFVISSRYVYEELCQLPGMNKQLAEYWREAILIPSLDEHIEDIPEMLEYYVNWFSDQEQLPYRHFNVAAQNLLRNHHWSGDITQLKQFIKAILSRSDNETIELEEIQQTLQLFTLSYEVASGDKMQFSIDLDMDLREAREAFEREYLSRHLAMSGNNMTELARRVGQERTHLYRKLKSLGLYNKKNS